MRKQTAIQVGGAMVSWIWFSYGIASQISSLNLPYFPQEQQIWLSIGVGWLVYSGLVFWGWFSASHKLKQYENTIPTIKVIPKTEGKLAWLDIENTGQHEASFTIQVSHWEGIISSEVPIPDSYNARWNQYHDSRSINLKSGESIKALLIQGEGEQVVKDEKDKQHKVDIIAWDRHWLSMVKTDSPLRFIIEILAEPKLKSPFKRTYMLSIGNDNKWKYFKED